LAYGQNRARGDVAIGAKTGDIYAKNSSTAPQGLTGTTIVVRPKPAGLSQ